MGSPNGDIKLSSNFELNASKPLDARDVVLNLSDLANISFKYAGMIVFVSNLNTHYSLSDDMTWTVLSGGGIPVLPTTGTNGISSYISDDIKYLGLYGNFITKSNINNIGNYSTFIYNANGIELNQASNSSGLISTFNLNNNLVNINTNDGNGNSVYLNITPNQYNLNNDYFDSSSNTYQQILDYTGLQIYTTTTLDNTSLEVNPNLFSYNANNSGGLQNTLLLENSQFIVQGGSKYYIQNRQLMDATSISTSIDWDNRYLYSSSGTLIIDYSASNLQLFGNFIPMSDINFGNIVNGSYGNVFSMGSNSNFNIILNNGNGNILNDNASSNYIGGNFNNTILKSSSAYNFIYGLGSNNTFDTSSESNILFGNANSNFISNTTNTLIGNVNGNTITNSANMLLNVSNSNNISGSGNIIANANSNNITDANTFLINSNSNNINSYNNILFNINNITVQSNNNFLFNVSNVNIQSDKANNFISNCTTDFNGFNSKSNSNILNNITLYNTASTSWLDITINTITQDRAISFPDKSGIVALLSDITGGGSEVITLTGDVSGSGTSGISTTIGANKVTYAKFQQVSGNKILGRVGILGNVEEISVTSGLSLSGLTLGLSNSGVVAGTYNNVTVNSKGIATSASNKDYTTNQSITLTGDVSGSGTSGISTTIGSNKVNYSKIQTVSGNKLLGNPSGILGNVQELALTSGLSLSGNTLGITTNGITNSMIRQSSGVSVVGRNLNSTGNVSDIIASSDGQVLQRVNGVLQFVQTYTTGTLAQIKSLMAKGNIVIGTKYLITNPSLGGQILATGATTSGLSPDVNWLRPTTLYPFGCISLRSGTAGGYISSISVNGIAINQGKVVFNTNINTTTTNLATNINAHSSSSGFSAVGISNYLIVIGKTATNTLNGQTVTGSATGITLGNNLPLAQGQASWIMKLFALYDISSDTFSMVADTENTGPTNFGGNVMSTGIQSYYNQFPWGDSRYNNNIMNNGSLIINNYLYGSGCDIYYNFLNNSGKIQNNFFYKSGGANLLITYNNIYSSSNISNNVLFLNSSGVTTFQNNFLTTASSISSNVIECTGSSLVHLDGNFLGGNSCSISSNSIIISTGVAGIIYNNLSSNTNQINSNTWSAPFIIQENQLIGSKAVINSNTFSGSATGDTTNGNLADNTLNAYCEIASNTISGANTYINFNCLSNSNTTVANAGITSCTLNASGNQITNCEVLGSLITAVNFNSVVNATLSNITIYKPGQSWGTFSMDKSYSGIVWNEDDTYNITSTVSGMSAVANNGLSNSPISMSYVPSKFYALESYVEGSGITSSSSGATIVIGMATDNVTSILTSTAVSTLNGAITVGAVTRTKATAFRQIIATPHTTNITAGTLKLVLKGAIGI